MQTRVKDDSPIPLNQNRFNHSGRVIIPLNLYTFIFAYPQTYTINPGINTSGTNWQKTSQHTTWVLGDSGTIHHTFTIPEP